MAIGSIRLNRNFSVEFAIHKIFAALKPGVDHLRDWEAMAVLSSNSRWRSVSLVLYQSISG